MGFNFKVKGNRTKITGTIEFLSSQQAKAKAWKNEVCKKIFVELFI